MNRLILGQPGTRYVRFSIDVWCKKEEESICINSTDAGEDFYVVIDNNPDSKQFHEGLYEKLKGILEEHRLWPDKEKHER